MLPSSISVNCGDSSTLHIFTLNMLVSRYLTLCYNCSSFDHVQVHVCFPHAFDRVLLSLHVSISWLWCALSIVMFISKILNSGNTQPRSAHTCFNFGPMDRFVYSEDDHIIFLSQFGNLPKIPLAFHTIPNLHSLTHVSQNTWDTP